MYSSAALGLPGLTPVSARFGEVRRRPVVADHSNSATCSPSAASRTSWVGLRLVAGLDRHDRVAGPDQELELVEHGRGHLRRVRPRVYQTRPVTGGAPVPAPGEQHPGVGEPRRDELPVSHQPTLLQHPAGGEVGGRDRPQDAGDRRVGETAFDQERRPLGGQPAAPGGPAEAVADLQVGRPGPPGLGGDRGVRCRAEEEPADELPGRLPVGGPPAAGRAGGTGRDDPVADQVPVPPRRSAARTGRRTASPRGRSRVRTVTGRRPRCRRTGGG